MHVKLFLVCLPKSIGMCDVKVFLILVCFFVLHRGTYMSQNFTINYRKIKNEKINKSCDLQVWMTSGYKICYNCQVCCILKLTCIKGLN